MSFFIFCMLYMHQYSLLLCALFRCVCVFSSNLYCTGKARSVREAVTLLKEKYLFFSHS